MAIIKYNPFSPWLPERLFSVFDEEEAWPQLRLTEGLDVYETDTDVVIKAAVPGVPADQVHITFEDGVLRIKAKLEETKEEKDKKKVIYRQQKVSSFDYTTTLPRAVDSDHVSAEVKDGVITITAPISEAARPKTITVKSGDK